MKKGWMALGISLIALTGCSQHVDLENYGFIQVVGFDPALKDKMNVTATTLSATKDNYKMKTRVFCVDNATTYHDAVKEISNASKEVVTEAQLKVILFSEEFARKRGLSKDMFQFYRDQDVADHVLLGIIEGSVRDVLRSDKMKVAEVGGHVYDLMTEPTETAYAPPTKISDLLYHLTSQTSDVSIPCIKMKGRYLFLSNQALFKGDKMVGYFSEPFLPYYRLMQDKQAKGYDYTVVLHNPDPVYVQLRVLDKSYDVDVHQAESTHPVFDIQLTVSIRMSGYTGKEDLKQPKVLDAVIQKMENTSQTMIETELKRLAQLQVDPFGFTEYLRTKHRGEWQKSHGIAKLKNATFRVHMNYEVTDTGSFYKNPS